MICRAIDSCLNQDFTNFEIIVIDDGSTDNTVERVQEYSDERLILLRHRNNQGVCPARNTGIRSCRGKWLLMLDSDFTLLPGTLSRLAQRTAVADSDIGNVASSCQWDTGIVTPFPDIPARVIGYEDYLAWMNTLVISEWFNCIRREVFERITYPTGRAYEGSFHLAVLKCWRMELSRDIAIIFHTDAGNRITASPPDLAMQRLLMDAPDCAIDAAHTLSEHGGAMKLHAPRLYASWLNRAATYNFLAGRRRDGIYYNLRALWETPTEWRNWVTLTLGVLSPSVLAWGKTHWRRRR